MSDESVRVAIWRCGLDNAEATLLLFALADQAGPTSFADVAGRLPAPEVLARKARTSAPRVLQLVEAFAARGVLRRIEWHDGGPRFTLELDRLATAFVDGPDRDGDGAPIDGR